MNIHVFKILMQEKISENLRILINIEIYTLHVIETNHLGVFLCKYRERDAKDPGFQHMYDTLIMSFFESFKNPHIWANVVLDNIYYIRR